MAYTRAYLERLDKEKLVDLFLKQDEGFENKPFNNSELLKLYSDQVINLSPDAILLINHETLFLEGCNQAALALLELDTRASLANYLDDLFQERPVFFEVLKELGSALKDHPEVSMEIEFTTSRSNQRWGHMVCKKINLLENTLLFIRIIDISTIKLAQQQLLESEQRLAEAQQIAQLGSYTISMHGKNINSHYSQTFCQIVGIETHKDRECFASSFIKYLHPDDRKMVRQNINEILKQKKGGSFEHRILTKDGKAKHLLSIIRLELDKEGEIKKIIGTIQDVSLRKDSEARLRESEERYRLTAENTNDGIIYWNNLKNEIYISPKYHWILDKLMIRGSDLMQANWENLIHPEDMPHLMNMLEECWKGNIPRFSQELRLYTKDYVFRWFEAKGSFVMNERKEIELMVGAISDIHNRKAVEQQLLQQDRILNFAQNIAKVGSWTWNFSDKILICSDEVYNIFGLDKSFKGRRLMNEISKLVIDEDKITVNSFLETALKISEPSQSFFIEYRIRLASGEEKVLRSTGKFYSHDHDEEADKLIGTTQDITEVKQREKELIQAKEQAEVSRQAKDRFLQIVSHEIRNPLNAIVGISRLLQQEDMQRSQEHINTLNFSASHLLSLINDILDTAKLQYGKISLEEIPFSIAEQLRQTEDLFGPQFTDKETTLEVSIDKNIPKEVLGDPTRFNQIIFNLISNAAKYTYRGSVRLEARLKNQLKDHFLIEFTVSDSGVGILTNNLEKIFDAFEQDDLPINQQKGGTGLGLFIVKELVNLMSGNIMVESEFGKGTRFIFTLPFAKLQSNEQFGTYQEIQKHFQLSDKRVLYVEDALYNQLLLKGYVKMWGMNLELADTVKDAQRMAKSQNYDLVLTDFRLPDGSGEDVVKYLKKINLHYNNIPYIVISAYNLDDKGQKCFDDYIQKPINFDKFFYVLRKYLNAQIGEAVSEEKNILSEETLQSHDALDFLYKHQPSHYQSVVSNMEKELREIMLLIKQSVSQRNYRLYLQMVHKLSSALKLMHENKFLEFLENMTDLPTEPSSKEELLQKLDGNFNEIIQRWNSKNLT